MVITKTFEMSALINQIIEKVQHAIYHGTIYNIIISVMEWTLSIDNY